MKEISRSTGEKLTVEGRGADRARDSLNTETLELALLVKGDLLHGGTPRDGGACSATPHFEKPAIQCCISACICAPGTEIIAVAVCLLLHRVSLQPAPVTFSEHLP